MAPPRLAAAAPAALLLADGADHLAEELGWLDLLLARQVLRLRATGSFTEDPFRGLSITDAEVDAALTEAAGGETALDRRIALVRAGLDARIAATLAAGRHLPLPALAEAFGLDAFARGCLVVAAATALTRRYETLFAYAQNDVTRRQPSVDLAIELLTEAPGRRFGPLAAFAAEAPLIADRLVFWADGDRELPLPSRALRVDDRVAAALWGGAGGPDPALAPWLRRCGPVPAEEIDRAGVTTLDALIEVHADQPLVLHLAGPADCGQRGIAAALCGRRGLALLELGLDHPAAAEPPGRRLGTLIAREARLSGAGLLLLAEDGLAAGRLEEILGAAARSGLPLLVAAGRDGVDPRKLPVGVVVERYDLPAVATATRIGWWRSTIGGDGFNGASDPTVDRLGASFRLGPVAIAETVAAARSRATAAGRFLEPEDVAAAARRLGAARLPRLARPVASRWGWEDLVLPERQRRHLKEIAAWVRLTGRVHGDWGFRSKLAHGHATAVLFTGQSGTGKTMAASIIARSVGLDLYRIDLASVVSKYIGETEQNIDRLFEQAMCANAVLLFDEADALFGKRTEVKDAHDRYANLETSYLLQRIEDHEGFVILATNLNDNLDGAFARRLHHVVAFPFPGAGLRLELWRRAFPPEAPLGGDLDLVRIAEGFELSGGNIRNAALAAAFLAAGEERSIGMGDVVRAVARELEKLGRPQHAADFGELRGLLDGGGPGT